MYEKPTSKEDHPSYKLVKKCSSIMQPLLKVVPGSILANYCSAKINYFMGNKSEAKSILQDILKQDPFYSHAQNIIEQVIDALICHFIIK